MKKLTTIFFTLLIVLSLVACTWNLKTSNTNTSDKISTVSTESQTTGKKTNEPNNTVELSKITDNNKQLNETIEPDTDDATNEVKVLVAYFSATNTTEGVAKDLADGLGADIYEIIPETPYTNTDLNYNDNNSRSTIEMNNPNARPAISSSNLLENMEQYNVIFLGYPIWWGEVPKIINTFIETYDFSGKTIVPFCTSGSSGIGNSAKNLSTATNGITWLDGRRFSNSATSDELIEWANSLGLDISAN